MENKQANSEVHRISSLTSVASQFLAAPQLRSQREIEPSPKSNFGSAPRRALLSSSRPGGAEVAMAGRALTLPANSVGWESPNRSSSTKGNQGTARRGCAGLTPRILPSRADRHQYFSAERGGKDVGKQRFPVRDSMNPPLSRCIHLARRSEDNTVAAEFILGTG